MKRLLSGILGVVLLVPSPVLAADIVDLTTDEDRSHGRDLVAEEYFEAPEGLGIKLKTLVNRYNKAVTGYGEEFFVSRLPKVRPNKHGSNSFGVWKEPEAGLATQSDIGLVGTGRSGRVHTAAVSWAPIVDGEPLDRSGDDLNAALMMSALASAVNPDWDPRSGVLGDLGFGREGVRPSFVGLENQVTIGNVTYTLLGYENDEGAELVWFIARASDPDQRVVVDAPEGAETREQYGSDWPFVFDWGTLVCSEIDGAVAARIIGSDGIEYALNRAAIAAGYTELDENWLDQPSGNGKLPIGRLAFKAVAPCD